MKTKTKVFIIDTSAFLSGKPLNFGDALLVTTPGVSSELKPGGRDYRAFVLQEEKGLQIQSPSKESLLKVKKTAEESGDIQRLSPTDIELLSLAVDYQHNEMKEAVLLTDDYSIQNVAHILGVVFQNLNQKKITKKFKWFCCCPGCGKQFIETTTICPICGTTTRMVPQRKQDIKKPL
ncbi:MAG: NOB1 family endonuclease [Methanobacteriota archaeon]